MVRVLNERGGGERAPTGNLALTSARALPATPAETVNWLNVCDLRARLFRSATGAAIEETARPRRIAMVGKCMMTSKES
jgi:hypothetical protein